MKFKLISSVLLIAMPFMAFSNQNEDDVCPDKPYYIRFDSPDFKISNFIIKEGLLDVPSSASTVTVNIYTDKHVYDRNDWVASFIFDDGSQKYYRYNHQKSDLQLIDSTTFTESLAVINRCNVDPEVPMFSIRGGIY